MFTKNYLRNALRFVLLGVFFAPGLLSCQKEEIKSISEPNGAGTITYTIQKVANPTADQKDAYARIKTAMDAAVAAYNKNSNLSKSITVKYDPTVKTANSVPGGNSITFGDKSYMVQPIAMHEMGHSFGVGGGKWQKLVDVNNKVYLGANGKAKYKELKGDPNAVMHADDTHFWDYGLGKRDATEFVEHVKMVVAIKKDLDNVQ